MQKINIFFIILFLSANLFAQKNFKRLYNNAFQVFYTEINIIPSDSLNQLYFSYRIPYNKLVFEKDNNQYKAGYSLSVEVTDSLGNFVTRQLEEKKIKTLNFEETNSNKLFAQGLISFKLKTGSYNLIPIFTDLNSLIELKSQTINLTSNKFTGKDFTQPLIVNSKKTFCNGIENYELTNFDGSVPFDEDSYDLIFPVEDNSLSKLNILLLNNNDTVVVKDIDENFISSLSINYCDDKILLIKSDENNQTKNFVFKDFNNKLYEGDLTVIVSKANDKKSKKVFNLNVKWFDKPLSLSDPEYAIKALKYADDQKAIKNLLSEKEENYIKALFKYWAAKDPTAGTAYNPLMKEYYSRVDYAAKNFATISGRSGVDTDRGKIFIQFGKPQKIDRSSNEKGKVVETWIYENPKRRFVFTDLTGTGNFSLQDS